MHFIPGFRSQLVTASKSRRQFVLSAREVERMGGVEGRGAQLTLSSFHLDCKNNCVYDALCARVLRENCNITTCKAAVADSAMSTSLPPLLVTPYPSTVDILLAVQTVRAVLLLPVTFLTFD